MPFFRRVLTVHIVIFQNLISAVSQFQFFMFRLWVRSKNPQGPLPQGFADIKKTHATNCLNRPFILREFFQNFYAGYFCYCQNGFSILRMNSFYPFESKLAYHKAFFLSSFVSLQILNFLRTVVHNVFHSRFLILAVLLSHIHQWTVFQFHYETSPQFSQ